MAKSLRSKVKRRHRTLKRQYISQVKEIKDKQELSNRLQATINNVSYRGIVIYNKNNIFQSFFRKREKKRI